MDGGIIEVDGYRPVQEMMEEVLAEHGHSVSECGVISTAYLQEQSYRAETQRAEAMKEKLVAEKPAPEANISFYVAECAEFPVMGEFHGNLTLEQALEIYDKIPAERMNGIKSIGFSLEDGSIYGRILSNQFLKFGKFCSDVVVDFDAFVQRTLPDINGNRIACLFSRNGNRSVLGIRKTYHYVICSFYLLALFSSAHR